MRRRELMGAGLGMLATSVGATTRAQHTVERIVSETHAVPGLATGLSPSGDIVLFGFDDGNVLVYDDDRDGTIIPITVDRSVSHIAVRDATTTAVVGWMDADRFAHLDLSAVDGTFVEHAGLWELATTPDAGRTASVTNPSESPGSVVVADSDGTVLWQTPFSDATGQSVAITDGGNHIAVAAGHYWADGIEPTGQPGIRLYDGTGTELWRHDHTEDVISIGVDAERELVVAGTDDGHTIVLDLEGKVVWETDEVGGWVVLSDDGGTLLTWDTDGTLYAVDSATGDQRWSADIGLGPTEDVSVSADGSRVFAANRGAAEFVVLDEGEPIWTESHDVGPGLGAIAADGSTWSTIVTNLDAETAHVAVYQTPDAVAEPEPAPRAAEPPTEEDDPSEEKDGSGDDDGGSNDKNGDPEALELVDYHILGEQASEEYITLRNTGDEPLEMSGWTIRDRRQGGRVGTNAKPFEFPPGFTLEPGAAVTIYTGEGESPGETLSWGYSGDFQIWNEDGDVVIVRDAAGDIILEERIEVDGGGPSEPVLELGEYHILGELADEEYITLRNTGGRTLDMSGWTIRDRRDGGRVGTNASPFEFPPGFTLDPGATVTIYTGEGNATSETLFWGYSGDFQIWNEEGDVVIVRDSSDTVVLEQEVSAEPEPDPPDGQEEPPGDNDLNESANQSDDAGGNDGPTDSPDNESDGPTDSPGNESDGPPDPPGDNETDGPADPPGGDETDPPADTSDGDETDGPTDPPGDDEPNEPADPSGGDGADQPADPPDDDAPDESTDQPDTGIDESGNPPAGNATADLQ